MSEATRQRAGAYAVLGAFLLLACATARMTRNAARRQDTAHTRQLPGTAGVEDAKVYWQRAQRFPRNPEAA